MEFSDRPANSHIFFIGTYTPSTEMKTWIAHGDQVDLYLGDDLAHIVDVEVLGHGRYRGRVHNFHNSPNDAIGDIAIGELVEFEERHVSACSTV